MTRTLDSLKSAARAESESLRLLLRESHPRLVAQFDPQAYAGSYLTDRPPRYRFMTDAVTRMSGTIHARSAEALLLYNKYMLLSHVAAFDLTRSPLDLPGSVIELYPRELGRILDRTAHFDAAFFDLSNDPFVKDLAIATHRLIPVGAGFADAEAGVPRSVLLRGGLRQLVFGLPFMLFRCGGFRPFLAIHVHILALEDFDPEGWNRTYHRLADLLERNPEFKGWMGESWYLDPRLADISPKLSYLRQVPVENGAALYFTGFDRVGNSGALARSPTRRRLFAEGRYVPATYMRVWPRRAVIAWSRGTRSAS